MVGRKLRYIINDDDFEDWITRLKRINREYYAEKGEYHSELEYIISEMEIELTQHFSPEYLERNRPMTKEEILKLPAVAIRFTATWCNPCKQFAPVFDDVAKDSPATKVIVDVSDFPDLASDFAVRGIPCVVFLKAGVEIGRLVGNKNADEVKAEFEKLNEKEG